MEDVEEGLEPDLTLPADFFEDTQGMETDPLHADFYALELELLALYKSGVAVLNLKQVKGFFGCSRQTIWEMRHRYTLMHEARKRGVIAPPEKPFLAWFQVGATGGGVRIPITSVLRVLRDQHNLPVIPDVDDAEAATHVGSPPVAIG